MLTLSLVRMITLIRALTEILTPADLLSSSITSHSLTLELTCCTEPRLPQLLKLLLFSQSQLEEKCVFPKISLAASAGNPTAS